MSISNLFNPNYYDLNCKDLNVDGTLDVNNLICTSLSTNSIISPSNNLQITSTKTKINGDLETTGTTKTDLLDCTLSAGVGSLDFHTNTTVVAQPTGGGALITTSIVFYLVSSNLALLILPLATDTSGTAVNYINFAIGTIPAEYRPSAETNISIPIISGNIMINGILRLNANGAMSIINPTGNFPASPAVNGWPRLCALYVL